MERMERMEKQRTEYYGSKESEVPPTESGPGSARSGLQIRLSLAEIMIQPLLRALINFGAAEQLSDQIIGSYVKLEAD